MYLYKYLDDLGKQAVAVRMLRLVTLRSALFAFSHFWNVFAFISLKYVTYDNTLLTVMISHTAKFSVNTQMMALAD